MAFARVIPLTRLPAHVGLFDYAIPESLDRVAQPGMLATIPFRKQNIVGIVFERSESSRVPHPRPLEDVLSTRPLLSPTNLELVSWFSSYYGVSHSVIARMFFPFPLSKKIVLDMTAPSHASVNRLQPLSTSPSPKPLLFIHRDETVRIDIYAQRMGEALAKGDSTLALYPSIAEAAWAHEHVKKKLGTDSLLLLHGHMSHATLRSSWKRILSGEPIACVGTRSALFAPFVHLAQIMIDQCERQEYKQYDLNPRYQTLTVAWFLAIKGATLLAHAVTPRTSDYLHVHAHRAELKDATKKIPIKTVSIIDHWRAGGKGFLTEMLIERIHECLAKEKRIILFLNKKGYGSRTRCASCGYVWMCSPCTRPFTLSKKTNVLSCANCKTSQPIDTFCPRCKDVSIITRGIGIEKIHEEVKKKFPQNQIRMLVKDEREKQHAAPEAETPWDILLATSRIFACSPALFNHVGLCTVLVGDPIIHMDDVTAHEKQFQHIHTFFSRARSWGCEECILQTFDPEHTIIKEIRTDSWMSYIESELETRKKFNCEPFIQKILFRLQKKTPPQNNFDAAQCIDVIKKRCGCRHPINYTLLSSSEFTLEFHHEKESPIEHPTCVQTSIALLAPSHTIDIDPFF